MINCTPLVRAEADRLGVDLEAVTPTGSGGRISKADVRAAAPRPAPRPAAAATPSNGPYALNPLAEYMQRTDPELYRAALKGGPAPTLFASGDLPPFTGSGIDVALLRQVPAYARPALALLTHRGQALAAFDAWSADPVRAEAEAAAVSTEGREIISDYRTRFRAWTVAAWQQRQGQENQVENDIADLSELFPTLKRPTNETSPGWTAGGMARRS